ncbi:MAG TPA: S9 family peptidase [Candidatus Limnocylindria bacterium]|nr:S9 family peptidase [Candidatus Limnocylindria bacterium]
MAERSVLPYGSWPSAISVEMSVAGSIALREPLLDGGDVYWIEGRPAERGRQVVVRWDGRAAQDVTPAGFNARTMAREYGGGMYTAHSGTVYFANLEDGRLYAQVGGGTEGQPAPITPAGPFRYGDLHFDPGLTRLLAVREDHAGAGEPTEAIVAIEPGSGATTVLVEGRDFLSSPRVSPDGRRLAWLAWDHPNMPWDGTELWLADIAGDAVADPRLVAGGRDESIVQPEWAPDGALVYVSDRSGWWNLYRQLIGADGWPGGEPIALAPAEAEFAGAQWVFGMSWYGIGADGSIYAIARSGGLDTLWRMGAGDGQPARLDVPDEVIAALRVDGQRLVYVGGTSAEPRAVVAYDLAGDGSLAERRVLRRAAEIDLGAEHFARPESISFPTTGGATANGLYYAPTNPACAGPDGERPPLVVMSHGGPTSSASRGLDLETQLFTSRGIAVVDVDYGGSTGYGRQYMRRLDGQWGIVDVDDCLNAARFLAARGDVDEQRMAIRGGSAGGYTTLCALVFHDVFACGASHYGVGDLEALARDTHKFESRYLDRLVAPHPAGREVYRRRSPINHLDRLSRPLIVLQGSDDRVVPVAQAEAIVAVLRERRIPHAYLLFEGEGHGFRQATNMIRAIEAELSFYAQIMRFELADGFEPVRVNHLSSDE